MHIGVNLTLTTAFAYLCLSKPLNSPMLKYYEHTFSNGLKLIIHEDHTTPLAVINLLYKVGSRNEHAEKTGFAHLFEHLMFGGSKNVPEYDKVLHSIGAENNAFTNTDITNYYIILNAANIETALWVESDRMQYLTLNQKRLDIQKKVVVEEFNQRYLNVPYGDVWLKLRPLAYTVHPYRWATIGMKPEHIMEATLQDVEDFYSQYYTPDHAVLTIAGNVDKQRVIELVEKYFGEFPKGTYHQTMIPAEPSQTQKRSLEIRSNVPLQALYLAFHMPPKGGKPYILADLLADLLGRSKSSRLFQRLVKEKKLFNNINAYITGSADPGLLVISGKINNGVEIVEAEKYLTEELEKVKFNLTPEETEKVINQAVSSTLFSESELFERALALSLANALGNTEMVNSDLELIRSTTPSELIDIANTIFQDGNCSRLIYTSNSE